MKLFISKLHYKEKLNIHERLVKSVLAFLTIFYSVVVALRNYLYDKNIIRSYKAEAYTVSIGNITTGGVGKTPVTAAVANFYRSKGKKVAILSRGYGATINNKQPNIISNGNEVFFDSDQAGDEPIWLANNCVNTPVITCHSRVKAAQLAVDKFSADVLIMDDGFQHRKMYRDLNLLLVDNKNRFGNEMLLPAGPLREPIKNIYRADKILLVNKSYDDESAIEYCRELELNFKKKVHLCKMVPDNIYNIVTNDRLASDSEILAFCAIGQPQEFYDFLKKDYRLLVTVDFEDHHLYDETNLIDLMNIANKEGVKKFVTTEKDAEKIKNILIRLKPNIDIYALKLKPYLDIEDICSV